MAYDLSLLDKSPIPDGATAAEALSFTVRLAQRAEALGYRRYWLAEHHGAKALAGSAPEVLVAHILARTSRIRVGSGGVMLQHYSPFKVAETFKVLASLSPGRVDLGIGKAPGGLPTSTVALQRRHDRSAPQGFDQLLAELDAFLSDSPPRDETLKHSIATPVPPELPHRVLLGGNPGSAALAASLGWDFCFAGHFNGDPANLGQTLATYRRLAGRPAALALFAFAADTHERATRLVGELKLIRLHLGTGQSVNLPTVEAAVEFAHQAGVADYRTEELQPYVIAGTAAHVRGQLDELSARHGISEFVIDTPVARFADRLASVELLAPAAQTIAA